MTAASQRQLSFGLLALLGVALAWPYAQSLLAPSVGTFHDDGVYLVTAKALATGQGYRIVSLPGQPAQTKYPILFPWLLSLVWRADPAFPGNLPWLRLVPFGAALIWFYLSWRLIRRLGASPLVATAAIALTAASPWTLFLSTSLLSESVCAAFVAGGLLLTTRIESEREGRFSAVGAGVLMGAAFLARTAAIAPAAAGLLSLMFRKKWRAVAEYSAALAIVVAPWIWWMARHGSDPIVDPFYSASNYGSWNIVFNYAWSDKLAVLYVNTLWAIQVGQYWGLIPGSRLAWIVAVICVPCMIRGMWLVRHSSIALATALYIGVVLAWAFPPVRFLVPMLPFLVWLLFVGSGPLKPAVGALVGVLLVTSSIQTWHLGQAIERRGGVWFEPPGVDDWAALHDLCNWVNDHTPATAVLIATHDPTFYLFTGRTALRPSSLDPLPLYYNVSGRPVDNDAIDEAFRQRVLRISADYVVITPRDQTDTIGRLSTRFPGSFVLVYGSLEKQHAVYQVDRRKLEALSG